MSRFKDIAMMMSGTSAGLVKTYRGYQPFSVGYIDTSVGLDFGVPAADRVCVVCVTWEHTANRTVSSIFIGGVAATIHAGNVAGLRGSVIASAVVSSGFGTITVNASFSGTIASGNITGYTLTGLNSSTPIDSASGTAGAASLTAAKNNGVLIAAACYASQGDIAWTGPVQDVDTFGGIGGHEFSTASKFPTSSGAETVTTTGSGLNRVTAVAWR